MPRKRIFIAINLSDDIKKQLAAFRDKWPELPARWTKKENLHLTLAFLGYMKDEELPEILRIVRETASRRDPFSLRLVRVLYGPPKKLPRPPDAEPSGDAGGPPRMIWAEGEKSSELAALHADLQKGLGVAELRTESRALSSHITLARIKTLAWRQIEPEERQQVNEEVDLSFEVNSIEVMESRLKRGGAEYTILESVPLCKQDTITKIQ